MIELESALNLTRALLAKFPMEDLKNAVQNMLEHESLAIEDEDPEYENPDFPAILKVAKVRAFGRKPAQEKEESSRETAPNKPIKVSLFFILFSVINPDQQFAFLSCFCPG